MRIAQRPKLNVLFVALASAMGCSVAQAQVVTKFTYDTGDNLATVTDPRGLVTTYVHDGFGQQWQQNSPDTGTTSTVYDAYGRIASLTRADGSQTTYGYDAINRRTTVSAGGLSQTFAYDNCTNGIGRLCSTSDANTTTAYAYTPEGWLASRAFTVNGFGYALTYGYNALGQVTSIGYPGAIQALYSYTNGVATSVQVSNSGTTTNVATNITYQPGDAAMSQWTSSNGIVNTLAYDTDGRLSGVQATGVQSLGLSYDAANRITGITDGVDTAMTQSLGYDTMSRLTSVQAAADNETLQYDANGNRINEVIDGSSAVVNVDPSSNRVLGQSGSSNATWGFDAKGNLTTANGSVIFTYDPFNRLQSTSGATYYVNPEGQRLGKTVSGVANYFAPNPAGSMMAEYQATNGWTDYIWLNGRLVGRLNQGSLLAIHDDQAGRPEVATDSTKAIVWRARNYAFDRTVTVSNAVPINLGFPGQYFDAESGLWNNGFRDYSAGLGRYIESDPVGLAAGTNTYAYVAGSPLVHVDPLGLSIWNVNMVSASGGDGPEGGIAHYLATTSAPSKDPCKKVDITFAWGVIAFEGLGMGTPGNLSGSTYTLDDRIPGNTDSSVLNGLFVYQGVGGSIGAGYSVSNLRLGSAFSSGYSGGSQAGLGYGFSADWGVSHVYSSVTFSQ